ncbi:MAG: type II secretion system F family protein [Actinomyces sp.]|jgi:tight adherence protein C|nr:type II secretion system F family protein [Actinomyces sp.]MCI1642128.1 type II secretion system F family protein [Actinomyces sp.]MCI1662418.1 type II secretion system F family protein [Actinomyces sp.]MCI1691226.1 type II secretion system F family protein [Actinomyces sp.]MCI1788086.1 type II secretion system F family protein [Actinomyces sp.]MCI1830479.1 type II secretion system F family protein [Actinomyces sp.]
MTELVWAAVTGACLGAGTLCVSASWRAAHPSLAMRVRQGAPGAPARTVGGPLGWARAWMLRAVEAIGSTTPSIEHRLRLLGRPAEVGAFRLQQFVAALVAMVVAGSACAAGLAHRGGGAALVVPVVGLSALMGAAAWDQVLSLRAASRQRALDAQVPDASELMALAVGAGESVPGALERIARISSTDLAGELALTGAEIRMGVPTSRALADLSARNDSPSLDRLCQTLVTSIERGSPLAQVLQDQARDIREATRQRLMEEGGRREIAMLLPVVFLILPVTVLFALYPGLIALEVGP